MINSKGGGGRVTAGVSETDLWTQIVARKWDQGTGIGPHDGASTKLQSSSGLRNFFGALE